MNEERLYMKYCKYDKEPKEVILELIHTIATQSKQIDLMANFINIHSKGYLEVCKNKNEWIEYFKKKVDDKDGRN